MLDFISHLSLLTLYPTLYMGIIFLGGIVLLPAMYLAMTGTFSLTHLFIITLAANVTAETIWYSLGTVAKKEKLYRMGFLKKHIEEAKHFSTFFLAHGVLLVFVSKFIYGTRIAAQVLAGMHRVQFLKYLFATTLGSAIWFLIFYGLLRGADLGMNSVAQTTKHIQLVFFSIAVLLIAVNWFTGTYVRKKLMNRNA